MFKWASGLDLDSDYEPANDQGPEPETGTVPILNKDYVASVGGAAKRKTAMDDKDVSRLEDKLVALEEKGQLRLDLAMGRIDATLARISEQSAAYNQRFTDLTGHLAVDRVENATRFRENQATTRAWGMWVIGTIVPTILVVGLGLAALIVSEMQVWTGGVQVGQALQSGADHAAPAPPITPLARAPMPPLLPPKTSAH